MSVVPRRIRPFLVLAAIALGLAACSREPAQVAAAHKPPTTEKLEPYSCGTITRMHTFAGIFLASQPAAADLEQAAKNGVKTVVDFRPPAEDRGFDEPAAVKTLGLDYQNVPFDSPQTLTDAVLDRGRALLADASRRPMLVHCHSANRVGAVWLAWRALDGGLGWDAALAEAKEVGLKSDPLAERVRGYVDAHTRAK